MERSSEQLRYQPLGERVIATPTVASDGARDEAEVCGMSCVRAAAASL